MLIIPAIDIMGGKVVRLKRGDFQEVTTYDLSPLAYAEKWEAEGARFIHVVDLDGAKSGEPKNFEVIRDLKKATHVTLEVGGGVRSVAALKKYLESGIERVVLSTKIIEDATFLLSRDIKEYLKNVAVSVDIRQMTTQEIVTQGRMAGFRAAICCLIFQVLSRWLLLPVWSILIFQILPKTA